MSSSNTVPDPSGLQTDFFQLVQTALYHADGMWGDATVDLYLRNLPDDHGYMVAAGIQEALDAIVNVGFTADEIDWIRSLPLYKNLRSTFFESLRHFEFKGDVWAVADGTPVFPREPILRLTAPLPQVGLFETLLTRRVAAASAIATRARRMAIAARGHGILDFGTRRVPGQELSLLAARAAFIGGTSGTTHTHAARHLGIPVVGDVSGTMLAAYDDESRAYHALASLFPHACHFNLPNKDPAAGIAHLIELKTSVQTVRIDHPELDHASRTVRAQLDANQMEHVRIIGGGQLDEGRIGQLVQDACPIDLFAVGDALSSGISGGDFELSYRLAALVRGTVSEPVRGHWCSYWPGIKQVFRYPDHDLICSEVECPRQVDEGGTALLQPMVVQGVRMRPSPPLNDQQEYCRRAVAALPRPVLRLNGPVEFTVHASETVRGLRG